MEEIEDKTRHLYKLFENRQPHEGVCKPRELKKWKKSLSLEISEFDRTKTSTSTKLRQSGKVLPNDLRSSWMKNNEASLSTYVSRKNQRLPPYLQDVINFVPDLMTSVVPNVKSHMPTSKCIEAEKKYIEKEKTKYWSAGVPMIDGIPPRNPEILKAPKLESLSENEESNEEDGKESPLSLEHAPFMSDMQTAEDISQRVQT